MPRYKKMGSEKTAKEEKSIEAMTTKEIISQLEQVSNHLSSKKVSREEKERKFQFYKDNIYPYVFEQLKSDLPIQTKKKYIDQLNLIREKAIVFELEKIISVLESKQSSEEEKQYNFQIFRQNWFPYIQKHFNSKPIPPAVLDKINIINQQTVFYELDKVSRVMSSLEATSEQKMETMQFYRGELFPHIKKLLDSKSTPKEVKKELLDKMKALNPQLTAFELDRVIDTLSSPEASQEEKDNAISFHRNILSRRVQIHMNSRSVPDEVKKELVTKLDAVNQKRGALGLDKVINKLFSNTDAKEKKYYVELYREKLRPYAQKQLASKTISPEMKEEFQRKLEQIDSALPSSVKKLDYFANANGTLASRLDKAWANYKSSILPESERLRALDFMIYVFDIKKLSKDKNALNQQLDILMAQRERVKETNPEYIPMLARGKYKINDAMVLEATMESYVSDDSEVHNAFRDGELLDVNEADKEDDLEEEYDGKSVDYLDAKQRAEFRVEIYNGLFHKEGKVFDSSHSIAHEKTGYVAFTLNVNGELSVFPHLSLHKDKDGRLLAHSSMNAGAPVLAAGELEIKNGKLISINTHSGHYTPSLYSIARFLEYLSDRGVDISETSVYLQKEPPAELGLGAKKRTFPLTIPEQEDEYYKVSATAIVHSVKEIMVGNINSLDDYLHSSKTKLFRDVLGINLSKEKSAIAQNFQEELVVALGSMKDSSSMRDMQIALECLDTIITKYSQELKNLNVNSGRLHDKFADMKKQVGEARASLGTTAPEQEIERVNDFKVQY